MHSVVGCGSQQKLLPTYNLTNIQDVRYLILTHLTPSRMKSFQLNSLQLLTAIENMLHNIGVVYDYNSTTY